MSRFVVDRLASGGVITNYHCVSQCGHCLYNCGPHRSKDFLDAPTAEKIFRIILQHGCGSVHIGGGEPLMQPRKIEALLEDILENSLPNCSRALGDTSHFHIDLYGNYIPGLCSGLAFAMEDLGRPLTAGDYPLLHRLATAGIGGLYQMAVQDFGFVPQRSAYLNHCDVCNEIRSVLIQAHQGRFRELAPEGHYRSP